MAVRKENRRIFATRAGTSENRGIEILILVDCTRTSYGKTVTKGKLVRQALFEICRCRGGGHLMKEPVFCLKRKVFRGEVRHCLSLC